MALVQLDGSTPLPQPQWALLSVFEHPSSFPPQGLSTCCSLYLEPVHLDVHRADSLSFIFQPNEMSSKRPSLTTFSK